MRKKPILSTGRDATAEWEAARFAPLMAEMHGMREVNLCVGGLELDFDLASSLARQVASKVEGEAMLLAWLDRKRGRECPEVRECMHKPGWLAYARGHGGDLSIVVNEGEYVFVFCPVERT